MKLIALLALTCLIACSNTRHMAVESDDAASTSPACSAGPCSPADCGGGPCNADVRCQPNGTCELNCTGPGGEKCGAVVVVEPKTDDC
jgi:hypothetical protein